MSDEQWPDDGGDLERGWPYNLDWPDDVEPTYKTLRDFADLHHINREDLVAMSPDRDPFYCGRDSRRRDAAWFSDLYTRYGFRERWQRHNLFAHLRRLLYNFTQQTPVPRLPRRLAKGQTALLIDKECWQYLVSAATDARYLDEVPVEAIEDQKNPDAVDRAKTDRYRPRLDVLSHSTWELKLPDFPDPPTLALRFVKEGETVADYRQQHLYSPGRQRYHQEVWTEKSTMHETLRVPCYHYDVTQQDAQGEYSLSKALELCERVRRVGKPTIVWYCSDCDPGDWSMPTALARKVEWCVRHIPRYRHLDITIIRLLLSPEQVEHYGLPWAQIKESEKRGPAFEERQGTDGSCELDAVEALYPGELPRLATQAFSHFHDADLELACDEVEQQIREDMEESSEEVAADTAAGPSFAQRYAELEERYDAWKEERQQELDAFNAERAALVEEWAARLEEAKPDLDEPEYELPEAEERDLDVRLSRPAVNGRPATQLPLPVLFHSPWGYLRQLAAYHRFQRRTPPTPKKGLDTRERVLALRRAHPEWSRTTLAAAAGISLRQVGRILQPERGAQGHEAPRHDTPVEPRYEAPVAATPGADTRERVWALRRAHPEWSQRTLAEASGISQRQLRRILERGEERT